MKVTSKGQVTIPKRVRDYLGIKPGAAVEFAVIDDKVVLHKVGRPGKRKSKFDLMRGAGTEMKGMTTDEIMTFLRGEPWPPSEP